MTKLKFFFSNNHSKFIHVDQFKFLIKWFFLSAIIGILAGTGSAFFLYSLELVTNFRESNIWIISLLPVGGFGVGLLYHYFGQSVVKGNNQLIEESHSPEKRIPFRMAPLVLLGTIITHLFGGSAGREGTAVQMGGAIADQFSRFFKIDSEDRRILLIVGISSGFASIFGTPLAGAIFGLEVLIIGRIKYEAILPSFISAAIAEYTTHLWHLTEHTNYSIPFVPELGIENLIWVIVSGIIFGVVSLLFSESSHFFGNQFLKIKYPPLRPAIGGVIIAIIVFISGTTEYIGLGVPTIVESFNNTLEPYSFLIKLLLTTFTLGAGFKGGEVTPLFFVGATLGNALIWIIPLPLPLLAGIGFVGVFAGATNTPIACTVMGIELFGVESGVYIAISTVTAYMFSGHSGIYGAQLIGSSKHKRFENEEGKILGHKK
ncbi:MAG: chloride channel protein [Candidatus Cloacimonadota bacterium]|nr:MAG: chloride channel protein [Candidatus Cloacimonadota bacterium]PIE79034.1 MAG: chloride channel protein [Candidatus Delongbacteria bacterium]